MKINLRIVALWSLLGAFLASPHPSQADPANGLPAPEARGQLTVRLDQSKAIVLASISTPITVGRIVFPEKIEPTASGELVVKAATVKVTETGVQMPAAVSSKEYLLENLPAGKYLVSLSLDGKWLAKASFVIKAVPPSPVLPNVALFPKIEGNQARLHAVVTVNSSGWQMTDWGTPVQTETGFNIDAILQAPAPDSVVLPVVVKMEQDYDLGLLNPGFYTVHWKAGNVMQATVRFEIAAPPPARIQLSLLPKVEGLQAKVLAKITFPASGYTVKDWGMPVEREKRFEVAIQIETPPDGFIGTPALVTVEHIYDLGELTIGQYAFSAVIPNVANQNVTFTVGFPTPPPPPPPPPPFLQVKLEPKVIGTVASVKAVLVTPVPAIEVADWGTPELNPEKRQFTVKVTIQPLDLTKENDPAVAGLNHVYELGDLEPGVYGFMLMVGELAKASTQFQVGNIPPPPPPPPPPLPVLSTPVTAAGATQAEFALLLLPILPVDTTSLGDDDLRVTGPNGYDQAAVFLGLEEVDPATGPNAEGLANLTPTDPSLPPEPPILNGRKALYAFPSGQDVGFTAADNGRYEISVQPEAMALLAADGTAGGFVPAGKIGVAMIDIQPPKAKVNAIAEDIVEAKEGPHALTVVFEIPQQVDIGSLGDDDIMVVGFNDRMRRFARFTGVLPTLNADGTTNVSPAEGFAPGLVAGYEIDAPEGQWTAQLNGFYMLMLAADGILTAEGQALPPGNIGGFKVSIVGEPPPPPTDQHAPLVVAEARNLFASPIDETGQALPYTFRILYIDQSGLDVESVQNTAISVNRYGKPIRPGNLEKVAGADLPMFSLPATLDQLTPLDNAATVLEGQYSVAAPDGTWDANDNGHYLVQVPAESVKNTLGNAFKGGPVGGFGVVIWGPAAEGQDLGNGWNKLPGLGYVTVDNFPWVFHSDHGWWFAAESKSNSATLNPDDWFYDVKLSQWVWTKDSIYPWLYSAKESRWLCYFEGTHQPRWFYRDSVQEGESEFLSGE